MNVPEFVDHVVMLMRGEGYEREGWDENVFSVAAKGRDGIVIEFDDGSKFELVARSMNDPQKVGVRYWLDEVFRKLKSKKAKDVVKEAQKAHG